MTLQKEISELTELLEQRIPANPASRQNEKLSKNLERELKKYFDMLAVSLPYEKLVALYTASVPQTGKVNDAKSI